MSISEVIRQRLLENNVPFKCNDNISAYVTEDERELLLKEVTSKVEDMLRSLVIDIENDHNTQDSARRIAKMYVNEIFAGRYDEPPRITSFPNVGYKGLYISGPITIRSTCAHHFQNISGKCWVGVIPEDEVIGLSKFNRIVHHIAERPQIQEEMTTQIADALVQYTKTPHIAVVVKAEHHCMLHRGVKEHENNMVTAIVRGSFESDPALRKEFYDVCMGMNG